MIKRRRHLSISLLLVVSIASSFAYSQSDSTAQQKLERVTCSNIVALAGDVNVNCSNLTPAQKKALKMAIENQGYLDAIMKKLTEMSATQPLSSGSISQSNSGGTNVLQGTTGPNSPIIDSPINVGEVPMKISPSEMEEIVDLFLKAKSKSKVIVSADQYSAPSSYPDDFYQALKDGGWDMAGYTSVGRGVIDLENGKPIAHVLIIVNTKWVGPNAPPESPLNYILRAFQFYLKIPPVLEYTQNQPEDLISIRFKGPFQTKP